MNYPFKRVVIDINNYFYIRRTIKKNQNTVEWQKFKLRVDWIGRIYTCLLYTSPSPRDVEESRMPSSA